MIRNDDGHLTVSSEATLLTCVGKATYLSTTSGGGSSSDSKPGQYAGYMTYRVTNPVGDDRFIIAYDLPLNKRVGILPDGMVRISQGVWEFRVYCSSGSAFQFDSSQTPVDIWIFAMGARNAAPVANYGLCLYDSLGRLTMDFNKPNPLFIREAIDTTGLSSTSATIQAMTRPVAIGCPHLIRGDQGPTNDPVGNPNYYYEYKGMMKRTSSTSVTVEYVGSKAYTWYDEPPDYYGVEELGNTVFILEGSALP